MLEEMVWAKVGDDVYGDDPTVNALEERVAEMFGKQAALFAATGSLTNQLAIRSLVKPGEELLTELTSHIVRAELGAGAAFSGITTRTWEGHRGSFKASEVMRISSPDAGPYLVSTRAIAIENTHNFGGGFVQSFDEIKELRKLSSALGINMHLDGARIWNAHVASGISLKDFGSQFDTISVCFSKGLGAPVGSAIISTAERIAEARIWRKRYGGGMRQVGIIAAAGHYALDNNIQLLKEDHRRAQILAKACAKVAPNAVDASKVITNIVGIELGSLKIDSTTFVQAAKDAGVWVGAIGPKYVRLVTHLDLTDELVERAAVVLADLLQKALVA
jgi:threonine aldolase